MGQGLTANRPKNIFRSNVMVYILIEIWFTKVNAFDEVRKHNLSFMNFIACTFYL